jgi:hypothetical protein
MLPAVAHSYQSDRKKQTLRLLRVSLLEAVLLFDTIGLDFLGSALPTPLQAFLGCGAILFGLGLAQAAVARFASGPGLILDDQGFELPHAIEGQIRWSSVASLKFMRFWPIITMLFFYLDSDGAARLRRRRGGFFLAPRNTFLVANLRELDGSPEAIVADARARWEKARSNLEER